MSFVTVFMTLTTGFVLLAPILMATVLVTGSMPFQRAVETAPVPAPVPEVEQERELSHAA